MKRRARSGEAAETQAEVTGGLEGACELQASLLAWYDRTRRDLPWRETRDPYAIWVSEIMLQQTRVDTVVPYYQRFLRAFPTVHALAEAPIDDVLTMWSGLGYYRRARMLHEAARRVAEARGGVFPGTAEELRTLQGVGAYTAGAIASIAFGERAALVDGNVARVLARLFAIEDDVRGGRGLAKVWQIAGELVPAEHPGEWNQALMELGATVCVPRDPRCLLCPVSERCAARARGLEAELPRLKPKTKPVRAMRVALVGESGEEVLLARRKPEGTFGGMWEPPSFSTEEEVRVEELAAKFHALLGLRVSTLELAGDVVHVLSHRRLEVTVVRGTVKKPARAALPENAEYDALRFVPRAPSGGLALTKLAKKILAAATP
jgi:A/G-specific adenine glycosylase